MKRAAFYIVATAGLSLMAIVLVLLAAVDAGAPILQSYMIIIPLSAVAIGLFFVAEQIAIATGMFFDLGGGDD